MNTYQEAFLSCTTRVGFELKLTRTMMEFLCALSDDVEWDRRRWPSVYAPDNWLATERALMRRGLVRRYSEFEMKRRKKEQQGDLPLPFGLTDIGDAVVLMLKYGGLFIQASEARDKLEKRGRDRGRA